MTAQLLWKFDRRYPRPAQLADAVARHLERVGVVATRLAVHPGELVDGGGLVAVTEDRRVFGGYWLLGGGE